jgi:hypothetical protein
MAGESAINGSDRRVFERFEVNLPARFIDLRQNQEGQAKAYDVSAKGIGFLFHQEVKPLTALEIWLDLPDKGSPLYTRGRVVWTMQVEPQLWRAGISLEKAELMGLSRIFRRPTIT